MKLLKKDVKRFWSKVDKTSSPNGCWLWTGGKRGRYGRFKIKGKTYQAHRLSNILARGPIPGGIEICHNCPGGDNTVCINPAHHKRWTRKKHAKDKKYKGQLSKGWRARLAQHLGKTIKGEKHTNAKLTKKDVNKIRSEHDIGKTSVAALGSKYKVTRFTIYDIVARRTWKHVK